MEVNVAGELPRQTGVCIKQKSNKSRHDATLITLLRKFALWIVICIEFGFFSPGATTPNGGCILQPSSGL